MLKSEDLRKKSENARLSRYPPARRAPLTGLPGGTLYWRRVTPTLTRHSPNGTGAKDATLSSRALLASGDALPLRRPRLQRAATAGRTAATAPTWRVARRRRLPRRAPRRLAAALLIRRAGKYPGGLQLHAYCIHAACNPGCAHAHSHLHAHAHIRMQSKWAYSAHANANAACTLLTVGVGHGERLRA